MLGRPLTYMQIGEFGEETSPLQYCLYYCYIG